MEAARNKQFVPVYSICTVQVLGFVCKRNLDSAARLETGDRRERLETGNSSLRPTVSSLVQCSMLCNLHSTSITPPQSANAPSPEGCDQDGRAAEHAAQPWRMPNSVRRSAIGTPSTEAVNRFGSMMIGPIVNREGMLHGENASGPPSEDETFEPLNLHQFLIFPLSGINISKS